MEGNFANFLILMTVAVSMVWLFKRLHLPAILAYLVCGIIVGDDVLALFDHLEEIEVVAELGVVFLLFSLGLEFSLPKMLAMRHWVFGVGLGQTLLTAVVFALIALALGLHTNAAVVIGGMAALSSTAIVIKQTAEMGILNAPRSQLAVSVLLFQDLAVVPLLILVPLLADGSDQSMWLAIGMALLKGVLVVAILMSVGKWILPGVFTEVARTRTDELFVLSTILVALIAGGLTYSFGLSMALGAFLAGMMLGESQYRHQLEADIRPFRDILMGLFFITVGMRLDLTLLIHQFHWAALGLGGLLLLKILLLRAAAWLGKAPKLDSWAAAITLCQMGEFSFVIAALAVNEQVLTQAQASLMISIGVMSMAITPLLISRSLGISRWLVKDAIPQVSTVPEMAHGHGNYHDHVLIFGFGRVGQSVSRLLRTEAIPYVAVDADPVRVHESRSAGQPVYFGDVTQKDILLAVGADKAKLALLTFDEHQHAINVIKSVASVNPELPIVVRTRHDHHLQEYYQAGATQVVPEILEGSLMLVSQVLHLSGVPMSRILRRVRKERKNHYGNMHGFFPGETTELNYQTYDNLEFMHAVILTPDAFAVGRSIEELQLERMRINIRGLRRNNIEIAVPDPQAPLLKGDVVVIAGKPRRVERAERVLLEGF